MNSELKINPEILQWAREECGYSKPEIADKAQVGLEKYSNWERSGSEISLKELIILSKVCKRQIAVFFLPYVPPRTKRPTDFRNLEAKQARLTDKTLLSFRRTTRYQEFLLQLHGTEYYQEKYNWISEYKNLFGDSQKDMDGITEWLRSILHYDIHEQLIDTISPEDSYKKWRNSVEQYLGIHVFQFALPQSEVQGFSYSDSFPYCIVINNTYTPTSRTFTLFHELSHVMRSQSGLCKPHDTYFKQEDSIEYDCNDFAGNFLVPSKEVIPAKDKDTIFEYSTRFKISSEVYLRRLFTLEYVSDREFFILLDQIRRAVVTSEPHYPKSQITKAINSRGTALFDSTIDAMKKREISYSLASDILGLKINYLFDL